MTNVNPSDVVANAVTAGEAKATAPSGALVLRGVLGGAVLAATTSFAVSATVSSGSPVVGALLFPAGITIVILMGMELLTAPARTMQDIRGEHIAMIFQDALSALNPVFPVGWQIAEMFRQHRRMNRSDSLEQAVRLMERVRIPAAKQRAGNYPHQFSGGMRQRIMIAMAIALNPRVLIADEPTTALDVTVQARILKLLKDLQRERGMGLLMITHDLGIVAGMADRVVIMNGGRIVEAGTVKDVFETPQHPYTRSLLDAIPGRHGFPEIAV